MSDDQNSQLSKQIKDLGSELGDQLLKLYKHFEVRFDAVEKKLDQKADKADADRLIGLMDSIIKQQEIDDHERAAIIGQLDRHERWHHRTAKKLGVKLSYN